MLFVSITFHLPLSLSTTDLLITFPRLSKIRYTIHTDFLYVTSCITMLGVIIVPADHISIICPLFSLISPVNVELPTSPQPLTSFAVVYVFFLPKSLSQASLLMITIMSPYLLVNYYQNFGSLISSRSPLH